MKYAAIIIFLFSSLASLAQKNKKLNEEDLIHKHAVASFKDLQELLRLPNDAHFPKDIEKNIKWCEEAFAKRGFTTTRLETPTVPLLLAERKAKKPVKTVLVYLQIDGQPVDSSKWFQESPWTPTLKEMDASGKWNIIDYNRLYETQNPEWRIFARSMADAKGPAVAFLGALDAMIEAKVEPNYNIKVIMDFEEELGSPRLPAAVTKYKDALASDMFIIFDGPRHVSNEPTLSFGARGICDITLTTYGPR
ncbi:MAG: M20/M25/M40 family metallo-hydrolase, partial [Cyclobacteriaceae bacterium]